MTANKNEKTPEVDKAPTDDIPTPDESFLTNPTDDTQEKLKEFDQYYMDSLTPERRALVKKSRQVLYDNLHPFGDTIDAQSLKDPAFRYRDPSEGIFLTGKLTIKHTPRAHMIGSRSIKKYLESLGDFDGTAAQLVAQVAQDLFITMKPQKVSVTFIAKEAGLEIRAQKTHNWGVGFK